MQELEATKRWVCPHHHCGECGRTASKAGGLLFACQACERAFCEDHLPPDAHFIYDCPRFQHVGHAHPKQARLLPLSPLHLPYSDTDGEFTADADLLQAGATSPSLPIPCISSAQTPVTLTIT